MSSKLLNKAPKVFGGVIILMVLCFFSGCTKKVYDSQDNDFWDFHIQADKPQQYIIRVPKGSDYPVPTNGVVKVYISRNVHHWSYNVIGDAVVTKNESTDVPYIFVMKGEKIVQKISTKTMFKLPTDGNGNLLVKIK